MKQSQNLKRCPFCGGEPIPTSEISPKLSGNVIEAYVFCGECVAQGPTTTLWQGPEILEGGELYKRACDEAEEFWNRRFKDKESKEDLKDLEDTREKLSKKLEGI